MKGKLFIVLVMLFLSSCDPGQKIELENKSHSESTIKFYFNGTEPNDYEKFLTKDSLILSLNPNETKIYNFGIGTWKIHHSFDSLVSHIDKIEIISEKSTQIFSGENQIETFFIDRLEDDQYKARILIEIN